MSGDVYIFDAIRTPRGKGKASGNHHGVRPVHLASHIISELILRQNLPSEVIEDVILGCVTQTGEQGGCLAKAAVMHAQFGHHVCGMTVNRFCASGLEAISIAMAKISSGNDLPYIAGGVESMGRTPMGSDGNPMLADPETSYYAKTIPQGIAADLIATLENYSRRDLDQWAVRSHQLAAKAQDNGHFKNSLVPIKNSLGQSYLAYDEMVRANTNMENLAKLPPSFLELGTMGGFDERAIEVFPRLEKILHLHHPGNSSSIVDGSAAVLLGGEKTAKNFGLRPRAKIRSYATVGTNPTLMLTGPAPAAKKALELAGLNCEDIDLFEVNEAFSSVVLKFIDDLNIDPQKVNVNGGAIALGHPLGATGAILVGTLLDELERQGKNIGLISMCVAGGMGVSMIIERVAS